MCYSPVRHSLFISIATEWSAFDLHVLGTPPAFILSQDQTLHRDSGRPLRPKGPARPNQESESRHVLTRTMATTDFRGPQKGPERSLRYFVN